MHARVFDTILRATFEADALRVLVGVAAMMVLGGIDTLVGRILPSRGDVGPRS